MFVLNKNKIICIFFRLIDVFSASKPMTLLKDLPKHLGLRHQLAKQLEGKGITDPQVLNAVKKSTQTFVFGLRL